MLLKGQFDEICYQKKKIPFNNQKRRLNEEFVAIKKREIQFNFPITRKYQINIFKHIYEYITNKDCSKYRGKI